MKRDTKNTPSPSRPWIWLALAGILAVGFTSQLSRLTAGQAAAPSSLEQAITLEGRLNILWADGAPGSGSSQTLMVLSREGQEDISIDIAAQLPLAYSELLRMRGRQVEIQGRWDASSSTSFNASAIEVEDAAGMLSPMTGGAQPWLTVMCKFKDVSAEPKTPAFFQNMYSSSYPLLDHYWREQSYNQITIAGSQAVSRWYTLPHPRAYYIGSSANLSLLARECTAAADAEVNYAAFVGVNLMFNADLDGFAWGGGQYMTLDGVARLWYMTWEPPWGYRDVAVITHEMGHGFGLPHSSFNRARVYDNRWDVMSDTWADCANLSDPVYGCLGQQTIAYHKDLKGWLAGRKTAVSPGSQVTLTLEQLDLPATGSLLLANVPINDGTGRFYTVEVRRKAGYDVKLPGQAVILHLVDPRQTIPAQLVDLDGNTNTGDAGAQWLAGETFSDAASGIWIRIDQALPTGFVVTISNCQGIATTPSPTVARTPTRTSTPSFTPTRTFTPFPTLNPQNIKSRIFLPISRR